LLIRSFDLSSFHAFFSSYCLCSLCATLGTMMQTVLKRKTLKKPLGWVSEVRVR
jgi:hypothetical protein